ncbi:hypothetical protein SAMN06265379_1254 [Saccharicrinis carchari]|uniref:Uncharacterized protein n=1 Tax=Saccharicrinis carchari TaxID=1168039 RepID=A0A521FEX0_SACCC|nr:hypothetical protein [Saccharicrinis carchari]SMO94747.1 hypothetical protein SAMN06265379_1254 [Saccharicrinis carchari]
MIKRLFKYLPIIEIVLGAILLTHEIFQFNKLPSIHDNLYGGLVDFFKYKEDSYGLMLLYSVLLLAGLLGLKNERLKWLTNWSLLIIILGLVIVPFIVIIFQKEILAIITGFIVFGFLYLIIHLSKTDLFRRLAITNKNKLISIFLGLFIIIGFWIIELKLT